MDFIAFGIIIDDIVLPDGQTWMGVLGGGGPQAAFGMRLWADSVGLAAGVGPDLPASFVEWLDRSGIDKQGLRQSELPTPRAWQVIEKDGRRTQAWRVPFEVFSSQLRRSIDLLPEGYRGAKGYHYGIHPDSPDLEFARNLRSTGSLVSIEPFKPADRIPDQASLQKMISTCDIFSPNLEEAVSLIGPNEPIHLARQLLKAGAQVVSLRMGAAGSLVVARGLTGAVRIPAVQTEAANQVGAGNAYCGGFLVGWSQTQDPLRAGLYGTVAASFLMEQIGPPVISAELRDEARKRLKVLGKQVKGHAA